MVIAYEIKGITLTESELYDIVRYFQASCTAECLLDNYAQITDEEQAMNLGYEVRRKMSNHGLCEEEAIDAVMAEAFDYADDEEPDDDEPDDDEPDDDEPDDEEAMV